ncbi:MAG: DUF5063 domain-containing protein [Actinomycetota bacterium]|nr:DUF5063 domain-containing protein [Actinomycetota bacterium]
MPDSTPHGVDLDERDEILLLAAESARDAQIYLSTVREVAAGAAADTAIPVLLLATAQLLLTGSRLGAIRDVVPSERFEPDPGPDPDLEPLRDGLANLLEGLDDYADVVDPVTTAELTRGSLSGDIVEVCAALRHGLEHYDTGRHVEALWWWQFSYLSTWGDRAAASLRVLQSVLSHLRLDVDAETLADAEFDALHP